MNAMSQMVVTTVLATTAVVMLTGGSNTPRPTSPPTTLRIESLSPNEVRVKVASSPWVPDSSRVPLGVWLDSVVRVADLVIALDVTVLGTGAVLLYIKEGTSPEEQRVAWGRDITLERGDNGHFHPIWKIHPLP